MANRKSNVPRITIVELKRKIELLLNNNVGSLCSQNALELSLQVGGGYVSRLKDNMYADTFELLCTVYKEYVPKSLWYESYKVFEQELVKQGSIQLKPPSTSVHHGTRGICLKSVIKAVQDKENVENVFQFIKGYWESFSYSTFHTDKPTVSYTIRTYALTAVRNCGLR